MHLEPEEIHYEVMRKFYWTRVQLTFEDGSEATVLVGAGKNYLSDHFRIPGNERLEQAHLDEWLNAALADITGTIRDASEAVYYKVYALSPEGIENGMRFLTEEVAP